MGSTLPLHNILSTPEPPHKRIKAEYGYYDNMYISTVAYGKTIFWKVDEQYLKARGIIGEHRNANN